MVISGYWNFFGVDSVKEKLDPKSVKLDRFLKNPVALYNHNIDWVIGEALVDTIELRDDGVYGAVRLPANQHIDICKHAVAMAQDGALRCFSVRFADERWEQDPDDANVRIAYDWELQEISLVTIPAQPDSTFTLAEATKTLKGDNLMHLKKTAMRVKGARVAELVTDRLQEAAQNNDVTLDQIVQQISSEASLQIAEVQDVLSGEMTPVPDAVLQVLSEKLNIPIDELKKANADDIDAAQPKPGDVNAGDEEKTGDTESDDEDEDEDEDDSMKADLSPEVMACVESKIPVLIAEGKTQEEAVGQAIAMCSEEKGCPITSVTGVKSSVLASLLQMADNVKQAGENVDQPTTPVAKAPEADTPDVAVMKSQLALMGSMVQEVKAQCDEMRGIRELLGQCAGYLKMMVDTYATVKPADEMVNNPEVADEAVKALEQKIERVNASLERLKSIFE